MSRQNLDAGITTGTFRQILNDNFIELYSIASKDSEVRALTAFWDASRTYVNSNSGSLNGVFSLTGNYASVYSQVNANSATWGSGSYQGTDIKALTAFWDASRTYVNSNSGSLNGVFSLTGNYASVYSQVNANSANWNYQGTDIKALTAFWDASRTYVNSNSGSLNGVFSLTGNYASVYSQVNANSATWGSGSYQGTDIKALTAFWDASRTYVNSNSGSLNGVFSLTGNYASVYSQVNANSATWGSGSYQGTDIKALTAFWDASRTYVNSNSGSLNGVFSLTGNYASVYSQVNANSANWNYQGTDIKALTAFWDASRTYVNSNSGSLNGVFSLTGNYASVYSQVNANSATWGSGSYQGTDIKALTAFWDASRTYVNSNSGSLNGVFSLTGNYASVYSQVNANSATWGSGSYQGTDIKALTAFWDASRTYVNSNSGSLNGVFSLTGNYASVYSQVNANSANWNYQGTDIKALTAFWDASRTYVNSNSGSLNGVFSLTGNYASVYSQVNANSATWGSGSYQGTDIKALTAFWDASRTYVNSNSGSLNGVFSLTGNYASVYSQVNANSANWNYQGTDIKALTAFWDASRTYVNSNSGSLNGVFSLTGNYASVYSQVNANSASWASNIDTNVRTLTGFWDASRTYVNSNSGSLNGVFSLTGNYASVYSQVNATSAYLRVDVAGFSNIIVGDTSFPSTTIGGSNVMVGSFNGLTNTSGSFNSCLGMLCLPYNQTGSSNIAIGNQVLYTNFSGDNNIALGKDSMLYNYSGSDNIALGYQSLYNNLTSNNNIALGKDSMLYNYSGSDNIALGYQSLYNNLTSNNNIALGRQSLFKNSIGINNLAIGYQSSYNSISGYNNATIGYQSLFKNISGYNNFCIGYQSLYQNIGGSDNFSIGYQTLSSNTYGSANIANGYQALLSNTTGSDNIANGYKSLYYNLSGNNNIAFGNGALYKNIGGGNNFAAGYNSLFTNTYGNNNTAIGYGSLNQNTLGTDNTAIGANTLQNNTTGNDNTAIGAFALQTNQTGSNNIAIGDSTLNKNLSGSNNFSVGYQSLNKNIGGSNNFAAGYSSLLNNTYGLDNIAIGYSTLLSNTLGEKNIALGTTALQNNTTGNFNIAAGFQPMFFNQTGSNNVALGYQALAYNTADHNIAQGYRALFANNTGTNNIAIGNSSLISNTVGSNNVSIGNLTLFNGITANNNVGVGYGTLNNNVHGVNCTAIGYQAGAFFAARSNVTCLGSNSTVAASNELQLGDSATTSYSYGAVVNRASDIRDKADIRDTILGLDFINKLRPVDYKWDYRIDYRTPPPQPPSSDDPEEIETYKISMDNWIENNKLENLVHDGTHKRNRYHHGLIAQDVQQIINETGIDFGGFIDFKVNGGEDGLTIRYEELISPLIKAVQELSKELSEVKIELTNLKNK